MKKKTEKNVKEVPLFLAVVILIVITIFLQQIVLMNFTKAEKDNADTKMVINVKDFGAKGDLETDDTDAIQSAINAIKIENKDSYSPPLGGIVYFPAGTYRITRTISLPAFVQICGEDPQTSTIYLGDNSNCTMIETEGFQKFVQEKKAEWYDTSNVPQGFGIKNIKLFGNKYDNHNTTGNGLSIYGYGFTIDNVWVDAAAQDGVYVDWKAMNTESEETYNHGSSKFFEASVKNLNIKYCNGIGLNWNNLTDAYLDNITISECYGKSGLEINAPIYVNYAHVYACHGEKNVGINANANIMKMVSESAYGIGVDINSYYVNMDSLQLYYNVGTDIVIRENSRYTVLDNVELRLGKGKLTQNNTYEANKSGIICDSEDITINSLLLIGENGTVYKSDPVMLRCNNFTLDNGTFKNILCNNIEGSTFKAVLSCGINKEFYGYKINATFFNCTTAFSFGKGCAGTSSIDLVVNRTSKQKSLYADFTPNESSKNTINLSITERVDGKRYKKLK